MIGLGALAAYQNRKLLLNKAQEVCKPDSFLCEKISEIAVLDYVKKKKIGRIDVSAGGQLSFSPTFEELVRVHRNGAGAAGEVAAQDGFYPRSAWRQGKPHGDRRRGQYHQADRQSLDRRRPCQPPAGPNQATDQLNLGINFGLKNNSREINMEIRHDRSRPPQRYRDQGEYFDRDLVSTAATAARLAGRAVPGGQRSILK